MPAALPLTNMISQSSSVTREYKTLSAEFGNGYSQDIPDGINWIRDKWTIEYENLTPAERDTLVAVLDAVGSWDIVTWTPYGESTQRKFKVDKAGFSASFTGTFWNISFTLNQRF
jgi:phage-related protein